MLTTFKNRSMVLVCSVQLFSMISMRIANAILVLFALELDASLVEVASINLVAGILNAILQIPFGVIGDKYGRKILILYPEIVQTLANIARGLSTEPIHLILSSLFGGTGVETPGLVAIVGDLTTEAERPDALSTFYVCSSIGLLTGPIIASFLLLFLPMRTIYFIVAGIRFVNIIIALILKVPKGQKSASYMRNVSTVLKKKNMVIAVLMRLSQGFFDAVRRTYIPIFAKEELLLSNSLIASLGTPEGLSTLGIRTFLGRILRKITARRLVLITLSIEVAVGMLLPFAQGFTYLVILALFAGLLPGIIMPTSALLVADVSTEADRGFANSVLYLAMSGGSVAPMISVSVVAIWGLTSVFPIATILPIVTIIVVAKFMELLSTERRRKGDNESRQTKEKT